jgi:hypothetical protein
MPDDIDSLLDSDPVGDGSGRKRGGGDDASTETGRTDPDQPGADRKAHDRGGGGGGSAPDPAEPSPERIASAAADETGDGESEASVVREPVPNAAADLDAKEIGHVLTSEEIRIARQENNVNAFIATDRRDEVRVGDYVQVPYPPGPDGQEELFAVIDALRYEPYIELDDKSDAYNRISRERAYEETDYVLVAELEPIAILRPGEGEPGTEDELERGLVNRIPKPNTPVHLSHKDGDLRTGLNIPHQGIFAGYLAVGGEAIEVDERNVPYYVQNPGIDRESGERESGEPAVFRHTLVAGSTGTGKTHFTKNLLRQYAGSKRYPVRTHDGGTQQHRLGVVVFDPENEYWQMGEDNPALSGDAADRLRRQGIQVGGVDDLEVFYPQVENAREPSTGQSWPFTVPFELVADEPRLIMPFEEMSDVTRGAILACVEAYFTACAGRGGWAERPEPTYADFIQFLNEQSDAESRLRTRNDIGDGTWSAVRRRVDQQAYYDVFDSGMNPFTEMTDRIFREGQVTIIPTSHLRGEKEYLVVLSVLSYIIENKIDDFEVDTHVKHTPLLVAVDEAHNYFSSPDNIREEYIVERAREAAKQGRKDQLGLMMITQNPEDIDDDILKQTNTNVFLHLREEVVEDVPSVPKAYRRSIPKFAKGQAVIKAPDVEAVEVVGLPVCLTRHDN